MIVQPGKRLQNEAVAIIDNAIPGTKIIKCVFFTPKDPSLKIIPWIIDEWYIRQRFHSDYMDNNFLQIQVPVGDALALLKNYQNLKVELRIFRADNATGNTLTEYSPEIYVYKVIFENAQDLFKAYSKNELMNKPGDAVYEGPHSNMVSLNCQLFEDKAYSLRNTSITTILRNVTMKDVLYYVGNTLGIKRLEIVPPDNTQKYLHLRIPPVKDISNVFDYLQDEYGIYKDGLNYYYTNETLYIYPGYRTNPTMTPVVHIYNVPKNNYLGSPGYHRIDSDGTIHILCNSEVTSQDMATKGIEKQGNHSTFLRADQLFDLGRTLTTAKRELAQRYDGIGLNSNKGTTNGTSKLQYEGVTSNLFAVASKIAEMDCTLLSSNWQYAELGLIRPGQKVYYHYEDDSVYTTMRGVVLEVTYSTKILDRKSVYLYNCNAAYILRLEVDDQS